MSTSRVGRKPVTIPSGVEVKVAGDVLSVKGPKGQLTLPIHANVQVIIEDGHVKISSHAKGAYTRSGSGSKLNKSITGTTRAKIFNMVTGVTKGFERKLLLVGVGYRAQAKGKILGLSIGFSHPVDFHVPEGITIETPTQTEIIVKGIDKHLVGHAAAMIRSVRSPEPYKGKGIRYANQKIVLKETKKK
jgi:large subunit ribosomal protein L6